MIPIILLQQHVQMALHININNKYTSIQYKMKKKQYKNIQNKNNIHNIMLACCYY